MNSSTEISTSTTNKRTRFSPVTSKSDESPKPEAPKKLLFALIRGSLASLSPNLKQILEKTSFEYVAILLKLETKERMLNKMTTKNDHIPSGSRLKFELKGSKEVVASADFKTLATETETVVQNCRQLLKQQIVKSIKVEINILKKNLGINLRDSLSLICKAHSPASDTSREFSNALALFIIANHHETLLQHINTTPDEFGTAFRSEFSVSDASVSMASTTSSATN